jgi:hypothetical protein
MTPKPVLDVTRRWFEVDVVVLAVAGVQCFVLATETERWFAWTVAPPLSAAVLGAGYLASILMVARSRTARRWVDVRVVVAGTFVFTTLTLVVTLLHLDRFHLDDGGAAARTAGVVWLAVYAAVPPFVLWLLVRQRSAPGDEPAPSGPQIAGPARAALAVEGAALLVLGVVLFAAGGDIDAWPWTLSDLTARAIAAWLISLGFMLLHCAKERELVRTRFALQSIGLVAVLWAAALVRFRDDVRWDAAGTVAMAALAVLAATVVAALRARSRPRAS